MGMSSLQALETLNQSFWLLILLPGNGKACPGLSGSLLQCCSLQLSACAVLAPRTSPLVAPCVCFNLLQMFSPSTCSPQLRWSIRCQHTFTVQQARWRLGTRVLHVAPDSRAASLGVG